MTASGEAAAADRPARGGLTATILAATPKLTQETWGVRAQGPGQAPSPAEMAQTEDPAHQLLLLVLKNSSWGGSTPNLFLRREGTAWPAWLGGLVTYEPGGHGSVWSGHRPGLQAGPPVWGVQETTHQ